MSDEKGVDLAKDNRPEVEVRTRVPRNINPSNEDHWVMASYEATCRYGCGTLYTPDVVEVAIYVTEHVTSEGHKIAKGEALGVPYISPAEKKPSVGSLIAGIGGPPIAPMIGASAVRAARDTEEILARRRVMGRE